MVISYCPSHRSWKSGSKNAFCIVILSKITRNIIITVWKLSRSKITKISSRTCIAYWRMEKEYRLKQSGSRKSGQPIACGLIVSPDKRKATNKVLYNNTLAWKTSQTYLPFFALSLVFTLTCPFMTLSECLSTKWRPNGSAAVVCHLQ